MVQSTEPEVFRSVLPKRQLGGWGLAEDYQGEDDDSDNGALFSSGLEDRTAVWAVSVPGETSWVSEVVSFHHSQTLNIHWALFKTINREEAGMYMMDSELDTN